MDFFGCLLSFSLAAAKRIKQNKFLVALEVKGRPVNSMHRFWLSGIEISSHSPIDALLLLVRGDGVWRCAWPAWVSTQHVVHGNLQRVPY